MQSKQLDEKAIFNVARKIDSPDGRAEYLRQVSGDDPGLVGRVNALLSGFEDEKSFLESPAVAVAATIDLPKLTEEQGAVIGSYRLLQEIGEGGFGVVYMAEQTEPVRRKVALKIIKPGMDTKEVITRFEAERQALALMEHPNIAKVLDAGATDSGHPYFVMELVKGVPLTEYCDRNHLRARDRLKLFVDVCHAVQHAHQKGVIHRDLKPTNIMVTLHDGKPVPKVIDFGVAKALVQQLTEKTLFTAFGQMVGTPAYMSPEQAEMSGLDIDTRSDVYSLGVILYELLTGSTPFDANRLKSVGCAEMQRIIREEEPPKPSKRLTTIGEDTTVVSRNRSTDPRRLGQLVRGDLDWIVMKALNKERNHRYETANEFAADIERFLNEEPVTAFPPSAAYKFYKFARRKKRTILTAITIAAVLVLGTCVSTWQAICAKRAERVAQRSERSAQEEAAISKAVIKFFNKDLLAQADPYKEPDRDLTVRQALDRASAKIEGRFQQRPLIEAAIRHTVGLCYLRLGEYGKAERHLKRAVEICRQHLGAEHEKTIVSSMDLATAIWDQGRYDEAEKLQETVVEIRRRVLGAEHPRTLASMINLANTIYDQGRYADAERRYRELIQIQKRVLRADHPQTVRTIMNLASVERVRGRYADAEMHCRQVLQVQQRILRNEHPETLSCMTILANAVLAQGRHAEAEALHRKVFEIRDRVLGSEHPVTLRSMNNLSLTIYDQGRYAETEELRRELLAIQQRVLGLEHPSTLRSMMNLANVMNAQGDYVKAEALHQQVFDVRRRTLGTEHPDTLMSLMNLANSVDAQGRHAEAEERNQELLQLQRRLFGPEHPTTLGTMTNLAVSIHKQRRFAEAEALRREVLNTQCKVLGPDHPDTLVTRLNLANAISAQGRRLEAEARYQEVWKTMQRILGPQHPATMKSLIALAAVEHALGRYSKAEEHYRQGLQIQRRVLGGKHPDTLYTMNALAQLLSTSSPMNPGDPAQAVELAKEAVAHQPDNGRYHRTLGQAQYRNGNWQAAIQALDRSVEILGPNQHDILTLALAHWRVGHKDEARMLYKQVSGRKLNGKQLLKLHTEMLVLMNSDDAT